VALFMIVVVVISIISVGSLLKLEELLKLFWEDFVSLAGAL